MNAKDKAIERHAYALRSLQQVFNDEQIIISVMAGLLVCLDQPFVRFAISDAEYTFTKDGKITKEDRKP